MNSPQMHPEGLVGRRSSSSRTSSSSSPSPVAEHNKAKHGNGNHLLRRNSDTLADSLMSTSGHSSTGAIPLTKNVGVSVNFGKPTVKSTASSAAGSQHVTPNGHQHQQQQHTPGTTSLMTVSTVNNTNSHNTNNNNSSNSAAINLGHGHIGTIAGPPSVSISSGAGLVGVEVEPSLSSGNGVNHNFSMSSSPAANAPTTCANKGGPSSHKKQQQQQHLSISSPKSHPRMSPNSPNLPIVNASTPDFLQTVTETESSKNGNGNSSSSSSSSAASSSRNGGNGNNKNNSGGVRTGPNSPSASSTTSSSSCSGGSKGETQPNVGKANPNGLNGSSDVSCSSSSGSSTNANKIVSQNANGTLAVTGVPSNDSEFQLHLVLQRANLLNYFDVLIDVGGDDVKQLFDAGEEEFLEIMALIGMASKPLHVRRLQKALQEWAREREMCLFQAPVLPSGYSSGDSNSSMPPLAAATGIGQIPGHYLPFQALTAGPTGVPLYFPGLTSATTLPGMFDPKSVTPSLHIPHQSSLGISHLTPNSGNMTSAGSHLAAFALEKPEVVNPQLAAVLDGLNACNSNNGLIRQDQNGHSNASSTHRPGSKSRSNKERNTVGVVPSPMSISDIKIPMDQLIPSHFLETRIRTSSELSSPVSSMAGSPHPDGRNSVSPIPPSLQEHEVQKLADAAIRLIRSLPPSVAEPKISSKRKTSADYELVLRLSESDPRRMEEVRRVAAVYGRADAKRKTLKPLSMHELAINEAASQLCKHVPALLTKREELLALSRQVLRESGLPYAAVSSTFSIPIFTNGFINTASLNNVNNNDINTKSKYDEINRSHLKTRNSSDGSTCSSSNGNALAGFPAKRFRLDGAASEIEIQEYSHSRPPSSHSSPSPPTRNSNGMQITELRCLPPRCSPSDDNLSSPLELVTVTSSDIRKSGTVASKSSSSSSTASNSPPIRRPFSVESDDLSSSNSFQNLHSMRIGHQSLINTPSVKVASIPVSGGSISILNHNGGHGDSSHHLSQHYHHHQIMGNTHARMKFMPIKSEPTVN